MAVLSTAFAVFFVVVFTAQCQSTRPNIVIFLVDDLGIGDIGCFGNDTINTPHIDSLAAHGVKLTHNLAPESVCTPSRAAFLTGRYAIRSGLAAPGPTMRVFVHVNSQGGLPPNETTFAEILQMQGYKTAIIGKWHLGMNAEKFGDFVYHPLNQGFDHFYGLPIGLMKVSPLPSFPKLFVKFISEYWLSLCAILAVVFFLVLLKNMSFGAALITIVAIVLATPIYEYMHQDFEARSLRCVMRNYEIVEQPYILENLTLRFTTEAVRFINNNQHQSFMLFMSFAKVHSPMFTSKAFRGHSAHGDYGDNVEEMDWSVGRIMQEIEKLGLRNNTFVYWTSDHGPHLEEFSSTGTYEGGSKGSFKGGKGSSWEGGIRVPTIVSWPGKIPGRSEISEPTNNMDIFSTVANLANATIPSDRMIDSRDLMPLLTGQSKSSPHKFMFHYCGGYIQAVRYIPNDSSRIWKVHYMSPKWRTGCEGCYIPNEKHPICKCYEGEVYHHNPPSIYELTTDPSEATPIDPSSEDYKLVLSKVTAAVEEHTRSVQSVPCQLCKEAMPFSWGVYCSFPFTSCVENMTDMTTP